MKEIIGFTILNIATPVLKVASFVATSLLAIGLVFLFLSYTIGLLPYFRKQKPIITITKADYIFAICAVLIVYAFVNVSTPYKK